MKRGERIEFGEPRRLGSLEAPLGSALGAEVDVELALQLLAAGIGDSDGAAAG